MEIEIKLTYINKPEIVEQLKKWGFHLAKITEINDIYFGLDDKTMSNKNKLFRIRNVDGKMEVTLKDSLVDNNGVWSRREINVGIDNVDATTAILESLGCEFIKENRSKREIWKKDNISFEFISFSVPAVLDLIEVEAEDETEINQIVSDLGGLVAKAGEDIFSVFDKKKDQYRL